MHHLSAMPYNNTATMHPSKALTKLFISEIPTCEFVKNIMPHAIIKTTAVRMAVARFEFTPSIPTFARIDVSAAKIDESNANTNHISLTSDFLPIRFP